MRILFCNKYNYPFSGTEVYLFELMQLLREQGHELALFSMQDPRGAPAAYDRHFVTHIDFKAPVGFVKKIRQAGHAMYSTEARSRIRRLIQEFKPDVAHVRNIYHHLSPSILWELKSHHVPVLYHLNDFKLLCPSYNLVRQGKACERCKHGQFWHAAVSDCYSGFGAKLTLTAEAYLHEWLGTYRKCVDLFLAPSRFVRDKFVEHGWDASKFEVLPHFQRVSDTRGSFDPESRTIVYFGRLSTEKGICDLLRAMQRVPEMRLIVAGDGPQRRELEELVSALRLVNVEFFGQVGSEERDALIRNSLFTVLPSHAYETLGKTILESYAQARAVVASDLGSRREFVRHGETGFLYPVGDVVALASAIQNLASIPALAEKMGEAGWDLVRKEHDVESHYRKLMGIYTRLVELKSTQAAVRHRRRRRDFTRAPAAMPSIKPLRVAFIGARGVMSKYSGIETYYEEVGKQLAALGTEVTVYCRNHFTPAQSEYNGMRLVRLPTILSKHLETLVHTALSTVHAITQDYDVVHYHALGPALFSFIPRLVGRKTVVTVQGLDWQRAKWGRFAAAILRMGERASGRFPNGTMVVSRTLQQRYRELHGVDTFYVPNGGVLRDRKEPGKILEWGLSPGKYILFLGRLSPEKGCHYLIEAFARMDTDVKLVLAGPPSYCDDYSRSLRTHAGDRVRILDAVAGETLDELLTNAMIFVLPSEMEGLSLALLDAMGAGVCVLASDVPENREVVDGAGFTFQRGSVADLEDRLRFLIANPGIRDAVARTARRRIEENYHWRQIAGEIQKTYLQILGRAPREARQENRAVPASVCGD